MVGNTGTAAAADSAEGSPPFG